MCPADGAPPCPFGEVLAGSQPGQWHQDVLRALEDNRCHGVGWGEHGPRGKCGGSVGGPGSHGGSVPACVSGAGLEEPDAKPAKVANRMPNRMPSLLRCQTGCQSQMTSLAEKLKLVQSMEQWEEVQQELLQ